MPIDDPTERKSRHLAYAQEVQELTMRLVRAAAAQAEQALKSDEPPTRDPVLHFVRLTRALNQTILLEHRIAHDHPPTRYRPQSTAQAPAQPPDPRRPLLRQAFHHATKSHPDRARRRQEIDRAIDHHLAADPARTAAAADILHRVSEDLDLPLDPAHLSDEILGIPPRTMIRENTG